MKDKIKETPNSLYSDSCYNEDSIWERIRMGLSSDMKTYGLGGNDIADAIGWTRPRTSKIMSGKQTPTADDVWLLARTLGCTPHKYEMDLSEQRTYKLEDRVRSFREIFKEVSNESTDVMFYKSAVNFELPLALFSEYGINAYEYAVRTRLTNNTWDVYGKELDNLPDEYIRFWQRSVWEKDTAVPEFGIWFSPDRQIVLFVVYLNKNGCDESIQSLRTTYKNFLHIEDNDTDFFNRYIEAHGDWIPKTIQDGEICSIIDFCQELLNGDKLKDSFMRIFREYCNLVWEAKQLDILPDIYKITQKKQMTAVEMYRVISNTMEFDDEEKEKAIKRENCKCEINPEHESFLLENKHPYVDVIPLFPFAWPNGQDTTLFTEVNAVCLCPTCSAQLKHGTKSDRQKILFSLFTKHEERLKESGFEGKLSDLLSVYGL